MTTYRNIHGRSIQAVTTDPTESVAEGQVWYNTTSDTFKSVLNLEAWSSTSNLGTARYNLMAAVPAAQTASLAFGGSTSPSGSASNSTEEYDGSGWAVGGNMGSGRYSGAGAGTQTAGLAFAGRPPSSGVTTTEEYDGSSWTAGGAMPVAKIGLSGCGTQTAGLAFGGSPPVRNTTEEYDGSSWTAGGTLSVAFEDAAGAGTQTAGLKFGGRGTPTQVTEKYDGSSWTTSGNMNTGRGYLAGAGIQTSALGYGGFMPPGRFDVTEKYDGSTWSNSPATMATAIRQFGGTGATQTAALAFGGESSGSPHLATTQEYNSSVNAITAAAWASGGTFPYGSGGITGFGGQTSAVAVGGESAPGPTVNTVSHYDGSSWTSATNYPSTARNAGTIGTQPAGLVVGANTAPGATPTITTTSEYDGTNWTAGGAYPAVGSSVGVSGTQTAALGSGGYFTPTGNPGSTAVYTYDGSSWTSGTAMNTARYSHGCSGSTTASLVFGGLPGKGLLVEDWNGSSWTALSNKLIDTGNAYSTSKTGVTADSAFLFSSPSSSFSGNPSELFNGTAFATAPALANARFGGSAGTPTAALSFSGYAGPGTPRSTFTEEFTGETSALNVKTLTQS